MIRSFSRQRLQAFTGFSAPVFPYSPNFSPQRICPGTWAHGGGYAQTGRNRSGPAGKNGLHVSATGSEIIFMDLISWMGLTETDEKTQKEITDALTQDLHGGASSGMSPYLEDGRIMFHRHWMFVIAIKA